MDLIHLTMQQPFTRSRKSSPLVTVCFIVRSARADTPNQCVSYGQTFLITTSLTDIPHHYVIDSPHHCVIDRHSSSLRHRHSSLLLHRHSSSLRHGQTFLITTSLTDSPHHYVMGRHSSSARHGQTLINSMPRVDRESTIGRHA